MFVLGGSTADPRGCLHTKGGVLQEEKQYRCHQLLTNKQDVQLNIVQALETLQNTDEPQILHWVKTLHREDFVVYNFN